MLRLSSELRYGLHHRREAAFVQHIGDCTVAPRAIVDACKAIVGDAVESSC